MRFSSIFSLPQAPRPPARAESTHVPQPPPEAAVPPAATPDVPDDLDERVRMVGEWQLGEAV